MTSLAHDLRCPLMSGSTDAELAELHGVRAQDVRALRDQMHRDALSAEVEAIAREIGRVLGSAAPVDVIVTRAMRAALRRAQRHARAQEVGDRHSVGGAVVSESCARRSAGGDLSGARGPAGSPHREVRDGARSARAPGNARRAKATGRPGTPGTLSRL